MKKLKVLIALLGAIGILSIPAIAADGGQIVIEDLTLPQLRAEIEKIQKEFYRVFNSLNDEDDFDIICQDYTATGTNIPDEACEPRFVTRRRAQNVNAYRDGTDELLSPNQLLDELQPEMQKLTEKMNGAMAGNQYFRELNQVLQMLQGRLTELTQ